MLPVVNTFSDVQIQNVSDVRDLKDLKDGQACQYQVNLKTPSGETKTVSYQIRANNGLFDIEVPDDFFRKLGNDLVSPSDEADAVKGLDYGVAVNFQGALVMMLKERDFLLREDYSARLVVSRAYDGITCENLAKVYVPEFN